MTARTVRRTSALLATGCGALVLGSPLIAVATGEDWCEAEVATVAGDYVACLLDAHALDLTDGSDEPDDLAMAVQACNAWHLARYLAVVGHDPDGCPGAEASWEGINDHLSQLKSSSWDAVDRVALLVSGRSVFSDEGQVVFFNNCALDLKLMSPNLRTVDGNVIKAGDHESLAISELHANQPNVIMVAPVTTTSQCDQIQCQDWTAVQPNTGQRQPSMWKAPNEKAFYPACARQISRLTH